MIDHTDGRTLSRKYESLDYDLIENVIYLEHQHKLRQRNYFSFHGLQRWLAIFIIGLTTAISGFFAGSAVSYLTSMKYSQIKNLSNRDECQRNEANNENFTNYHMLKCMMLPYLVWLSWNILFTLFGTLLVTYIAPVAAGSGIPVVKCYLNGVKIPQVVRFKTYLVKLLGVVSSVVGGLAVGKEGPFIHCGAAIGAGVSQGKSTTFGFDLGIFKPFRNDRDKRDFVSAGASAGVATAFGAPIGGVLFALEEGASFWNQALTWRIFFCSMMTSFTLNLLMSAYNHHAGILAFYSLVNFGLVEELDYFWFEIPIYICIAIFGGMIGASFCYFHVIITNFRHKYISNNWTKVIEAVFVAILTTTAGAVLILYASECRKLPTLDIATNNFSIGQSSARSGSFEEPLLQHGLIYRGLVGRNLFWSQNFIPKQDHLYRQPLKYDGGEEIKKALNGHILTFVCPPGEYSAMSSLWMQTSEGVSSTFMVIQESIWSMKTLTIFLFVYYFLAVITYGLSVSSGVFIPSLLIGATGGRLVGLLLLHYLGPMKWLVQQNKFAIIGAVSVLGGVVRMTISLTVIVIEATGCISFGLPIMICLMISKWVADIFVEGLYDLAIKMANIPFLDWEPPSGSYSIYASDIMQPHVSVLKTTETVANLVNILKTTTHNGFPVIDFEYNGEFLNENVLGGDSARITNASNETNLNQQSTSSDYHTPPAEQNKTQQTMASSVGSTQDLIKNEEQHDDRYLIGSFQRCSVQRWRQSQGRFRGLVLRWQLLVMLQLKIFNENERSYENLNLPAFQEKYPRYPDLDGVIDGLDEQVYDYHVDLRSIMNPTPYIVHYSASFPRIFQMFRSLGLRHLVVIDDRNYVVGMITRKDLARYVRERDESGRFKFYELRYSS